MTTPDKEEMPTEDRTAGPRWVQSPHHPRVLYDSASNGGIIECDSPEVAAYIVTACNAYEPMREALQGYIDNCTNEECEHCIKARAALSTLPVNDRHHSGSDNERNFENVRDAWKIIWEREAEIARLSRSLSELEAHHVEQNRLKRRSEADSKTLRIIRAALYGTDRQTSDDVGRLRALLVALDALIEQCRPLIAVDAFVLRDAIYEAHQARAALKGVPHPAIEAGKLSTENETL